MWYRTFIDKEGIQTLPEPAERVRGPRTDSGSSAARVAVDVKEVA
jgi:hypothetical protein